jgi:hypothetical protein
MIRPIGVPNDIVVVDGARRCGSELRWNVVLDGAPAVLAQLAPELAADPSIRERWIGDTARMAALAVPCHCGPTRTGPDATQADRDAPPWRARPQPAGTSLESWLDAHAPAPADEVVRLMLRIAVAVAQVHGAGAVLRDLGPRNIILDGDTVWLVDIGLSRTDVLSSRTAASLLVEDSPYTAPELLRRTSVDRRVDVYSLGVIAHVALTGVTPWGDRGAVLRPPGEPPGVRTLRPEIPVELEAIVSACLAEDPAARPDGADALVDALQGRRGGDAELRRAVCQACGASMRLGQRLCTACGKTVVQFERSPSTAEDAKALVLTKAAEDAAFLVALRTSLAAVADGAVPPLNILVGDERMYSKREREQMLRLPLRLFDGLAPATADALSAHLARAGIKTKIVAHRRSRRRPARVAAALVAIVSALLTGGLLLVGAKVAAGIVFAIGLIGTAIVATLGRRTPPAKDPLLRLRPATAALPASDPWVARLGALLGPTTVADVREQIGELALAVQRLVDHRVEHLRERAEIDLVTEPVEALVGLVEREVATISALDNQLRELDEGDLVRAIARSEARGEPAADTDRLRVGLVRLRGLEDDRARAMHRLLDAARLLRRSVALGLGVRDADLEHARLVAASLAALQADPH